MVGQIRRSGIRVHRLAGYLPESVGGQLVSPATVASKRKAKLSKRNPGCSLEVHGALLKPGLKLSRHGGLNAGCLIANKLHVLRCLAIRRLAVRDILADSVIRETAHLTGCCEQHASQSRARCPSCFHNFVLGEFAAPSLGQRCNVPAAGFNLSLPFTHERNQGPASPLRCLGGPQDLINPRSQTGNTLFVICPRHLARIQYARKRHELARCEKSIFC
jgi:hypothetical protein